MGEKQVATKKVRLQGYTILHANDMPTDVVMAKPEAHFVSQDFIFSPNF